MKRKTTAIVLGSILAATGFSGSVYGMTIAQDAGGDNQSRAFYIVTQEAAEETVSQGKVDVIAKEAAVEDTDETSILYEEETKRILDELKGYGVTYDSGKNQVFYEGKKVRWVIDRQKDDSMNAVYMPEGEIDLYTVRDEDFNLIGVRIGTEEEYEERTDEEAGSSYAADGTYVREGSVSMKKDSMAEEEAESDDYAEESIYTWEGSTSMKEDSMAEEEAESDDYAEESTYIWEGSAGIEKDYAAEVETAEDSSFVENDKESEQRRKEYKENGIDYNKENGSWIWQGKPVYLLMDEDGSFYQNGGNEAREDEICLVVERKTDGSVYGVKLVSAEEIQKVLAQQDY